MKLKTNNTNFLVKFSSILMLFGSLQAYTIEQTAPTTQEKSRSTPQHIRKKWSPRVVFGGQYGNKRNLGQVSLFTPLGQTDDQLLYADLRFASAFNRSKEGSLGLGSRWTTLNNKAILGIYAFYDHQLTKLRGTVNQMTLGAEILSETWDYRLNFYCPQNAKKTLETKQDSPLLTSIQQEGANTYRVISQPITMTKTKEVSLRGLDLEVGNSIPGIKNLRIYGGYYHYHGRKGVKSVNGIRLRGNFRLNHAVSIIAEGSHDKLRKTNAFVGLQLTLAIGSPSNTKKEAGGLDQRMVELAERNRQVFTTHTTTTSTTSTPLSKTLLMGNPPNSGTAAPPQDGNPQPYNQPFTSNHSSTSHAENSRQNPQPSATIGSQGGQNDDADQHHDAGANPDNPMPDQEQHHGQQEEPVEEPIHDPQSDEEFPIDLDPEQEQHTDYGDKALPFVRNEHQSDEEDAEDALDQDPKQDDDAEQIPAIEIVHPPIQVQPEQEEIPYYSQQEEPVQESIHDDDEEFLPVLNKHQSDEEDAENVLDQDPEQIPVIDIVHPPIQGQPPLENKKQQEARGEEPAHGDDEEDNDPFDFDMSSRDSNSDSEEPVDLSFLNGDATTFVGQTQRANHALHQDKEDEILAPQQQSEGPHIEVVSDEDSLLATID